MKWLVGLAVALAAAGAESPGCDVCLHGRCLARTEFYPGVDAIVSPEATIDYNNNIMYFTDGSNRRHKTAKAVNLDDKKINSVPLGSENSSLSDLRVDHSSGDVYYFDDQILVHKYQPTKNQSTRLDNTQLTHRGVTGMWVHEGKVYFSDVRDYGVHFISGPSIVNIDAFGNELISNVEFDKNGNMYVSASGIVKRLKKNEERAVDLTNSSYVITSDKNGDLYFVKTWKKLIYQLDFTTDLLKEIGAYDVSNYINKVMFDKHKNMISLHVTNRRPFVESWFYFKATGAECSYRVVENVPQIFQKKVIEDI